MAADGSIIIDTRLDTSGFKTGEANMKKGFAGLSGSLKKLGGAIAGVFAVKALWEFGKSAIELGSDLQEVQNVVDSVFTTLNDDVNEFAKSAAQTAGLSETMAKKYAGTFGAMAKSFGFAENEAFDMSTALTQLTGDVASFYNLTQDEAYTKLKSVFTGETESLKDLGVVMTQTALDSYALANGFGETTSAMTEQEKVALRYQFVMNQLATASGDFLRTSGGWANQVRVLKLQIESLKATIGAGLINIFTPVIKVINVLLAKLATVANAFKAFAELITGNKSSGQTTASGAGIDSTEYDAAADSAQSVADATDNIAKANKNAKKAQDQYLSGLDEVRRYGESDYSSPSSGDSASGSGLGGAIASVDYGKMAEGETVLEKTESMLDKIIKRLKELQKILKKGFWDGLGDYKPILEGLQSDIDSIKQSFTEIFTSAELIKSAEQFANTFAYSIGNISGSFANIGLNIAAFVVGGLESYLKKNKKRISTFFVEMFDISSDISKIASDFSTALSEIFSTLGTQEAQTLSGSLIGIFAEIRMVLTEMSARIGRDAFALITGPFIQNSDLIQTAILGTITAIQPFVDGVLNAVSSIRDKVSEFYLTYLKPFFDDIQFGLGSILQTLLELYNTHVLPVIDSISQKIQEFLGGPFGELVSSILSFFGTIISNLQKIWNEILVPFINWFHQNIIPVIMPIVDKLVKISIDWLGAVSKMGAGILKVLGGLIDFVVGNFTGDWEQAYQGLEDIGFGFQESIEAIYTFVQDKILQPFLDFMSDIFEKDWTETFGELGSVLNSFFDDVEDVWEDIKEVFNGIVSFVKNIFAGNWLDAWQFIVNIFKGIFEKLIGLAKSPINGVISLINGLIDALNGLLTKIESAFSFSYDFEVLGKRYWGNYGLDLPTISHVPYLAKGAVIPPNAPFMAMLGDQKHGTNIEAPLDTIKQAVAEVIGNQSHGGQYTFIGQINRRTLFEEFIDEAQIVMAQTGYNPFDIA